MPLLGFGDRIRRALLDHASQIGRRYTAQEFARELGMAERGEGYSPQAVSEWIAERREPSLATFHAMATVLNKPVAWLMALDQPPAVSRLTFVEPEDAWTLLARPAKRAGRKRR